MSRRKDFPRTILPCVGAALKVCLLPYSTSLSYFFPFPSPPPPLPLPFVIENKIQIFRGCHLEQRFYPAAVTSLLSRKTASPSKDPVLQVSTRSFSTVMFPRISSWSFFPIKLVCCCTQEGFPTVSLLFLRDSSSPCKDVVWPFISSESFKKVVGRWTGDRAQRSRVHTTLEGDLSSAASTHVRPLLTVTPFPGDLKPSFSLNWYPIPALTYTYFGLFILSLKIILLMAKSISWRWCISLWIWIWCKTWGNFHYVSRIIGTVIPFSQG